MHTWRSQVQVVLVMVFLQCDPAEGFLENFLPNLDQGVLGTALDILNEVGENSWAPESLADRRDLQCPCKEDEPPDPEGNTKKTCCTCHAVPVWEGKETDLYIEYISDLGRALLLSDRRINNTTVYQAVHVSGELSFLPSNLCNWDKSKNLMERYRQSYDTFEPFWTRLVRLDFSKNYIRSLENINCLKNLDYLNLNHNRLTHVPNTSFTELSHLRCLYLGNNIITTLDSGITFAPSMHLTHVDLSENLLTSLDVTNVISQYPFCNFDFSFNQLEEFTNELKVDFHCVVQCEKTYGPGFVSFSNNVFREFPDFKELLGLESIAQLGQLLDFGFDFTNIQLNCDCVFEPLLELAMEFVVTHWRDYMNVTCCSPPHLANIPVVKVELDDFICELGRKDGCPVLCTCIDQPSKDTVFVNCSNQQLRDFPDEMHISKYSENVDLDLSGNLIREVANMTYFCNLSSLNLSNNDVEVIHEDAAESLGNAVLSLSGNSRLHSLPQNLQFRNMCHLNMDGLLIDCNCETDWLSDWVDVKGCMASQHWYCRVPEHGTMAIGDFDPDLLECKESNKLMLTLTIVLGTLFILLAVFGVLFIYFKYEIMILFLRLLRKQCKQTRVHPGYTFDAYLSFDQDDRQLTTWVYRVLLAHLEKEGYKIFYPPRDLMFGAVTSSDTITAIQHSKNFVLVLSASYVAQEDRCEVDEEWKFGWNMFKSDSRKNIVLINYDHISSFDTEHSQIKAFLRVGGQVAFHNHRGEIMNIVENKLGPPCASRLQTEGKPMSHKDDTVFYAKNFFANARPRFRIDQVAKCKPDLDDTLKNKFPVKKLNFEFKI